MMIKSPYNFVPAPSENEVFIPDWADQVSHDIPFSDGESGEIEFTITAETPIFIRNGHSKPADGEGPTDEFSHYIDKDGQKKYFIPATSIKGMLRNVLEIMSFGKMKIDTDIESKVYGLRDMANDEYSKKEIRNVQAGWLYQEDGHWKISPASFEGRISCRAIKVKFNLPERFLESEIAGSGKLEMLSSNISNNYNFRFEKELKKGPFKYGDLYAFAEHGNKLGRLVVYGNIGNKHYDFIFGDKTTIKYDIPDELIKNTQKTFDTIESSEFKFYKKLGEIPIFFKVENNRVKHFGLSKLYRLNNAKEVKNFTYQYKTDLDLAETIFGTTEGKGRIFVGHAKANGNVRGMTIQERVLSTPRPSFYPNYLTQPSGLEDERLFYNTYHSNSNEVKVRGFKRYPVHINTKMNGIHENENIPSSFCPLPSETSFNASIRFHNLRPIEIGAIISSLTFHGNSDSYFHSIGGAKPYGFGKVSIKLNAEDRWKKYLHQFEFWATSHRSDWLNSSQIKELMAMASNPIPNINSHLVYPKLEPTNEFTNVKKGKKYLLPYSELSSYSHKVNSKIDKNSPEIMDAEANKKLEIESILATQPRLKGEFDRFSDLSKYLNDEYGLWQGFTGENKNWIIEMIKAVNLSHKDSRKKLLTDQPWEKNIPKWLGSEQAESLRDELTKP